MPQPDDHSLASRYARLPLFEGVPAEKVPRVLRCLNASVRRYDRQEHIVEPGSRQRHTGYLCAGHARLVSYDVAGNTSILGEYAPGSAIAAERFFGLEAPSHGCVVAVEPCDVLVLDLDAAVEARPCCRAHVTRIRENLARIALRMNADLLRRLGILSQRTTREKALAFLAQQAEAAGADAFDIPYSRQELADLLYVERSALSHELGRLQDEGLIRFRRRRFELLRPLR
ncbi:Crp/Fnr family transcriptional regulator [Adlercreutzia faecimuris]|uniref:Crp/Fnr family transcriptional regulator n=1 Tax=Adlercreutzia faecimuris TaxID=2897341 RepID=A0ABS9WHA5_9ACTN|nr:Crp/Fnr family transcriptional regulator [Adlercreutzia sp. JBNU-10]